MIEINKEFKEKITQVIEDCKSKKIYVVPYCWIRQPEIQANIYTEGRTEEKIKEKIDYLNKNKAPYLSQCLMNAYGKGLWKIYTKIKTNALPGHSWHQYGLAVDCYIHVGDKKPIWDSNHSGYKLYADVALNNGLVPSYYWEGKLKEAVHVQQPKETSPSSLYSLQEIDKMMKANYCTSTKTLIENKG